jgi:serine/threonine-protein kinase PknK
LLEEVRARDLFLRGVDEELVWFRYHALFAEFLRRRLVEQHPGLLERLHATACEWFAEHEMVSEAVDEALAAGTPGRAVELVQARGEESMENARIATFLGLVAKLPEPLTVRNPRLQAQIAWANIAMQRLDVVATALDRADAALAGAADDEQTNEIRFEVALARTAAAVIGDQAERVPEWVLARVAREPIRPFLAVGTAMTAMSSAFYRSDFDEVQRWRRWVEPYRDLISGPFGIVYCYCVAGMAADEQLNMAAAESYYRSALSLALPAGRRAYGTTLVSALLGELLYEKGQFIEAEELLDVALGAEGGAGEFLLAVYGTGARLAGVRGDLDTARQRLSEGAEIAARFSIPRLAAKVVNERIRLGLPIAETDRRDLERLAPYTVQPNAAAARTAELEHDSAIRLLLAERSSGAAELANRRVERLVGAIAGQGRARALLQAELLRGCCLSASGQMVRAAQLLAPVLSRCAELGLVRVVVDAGVQLQPVVETLYGATGPSAPPRPFLRQLSAEFEQLPPHRSRQPQHEPPR